MTVTRSTSITCDGCGTTSEMNFFKGKWLQVQSMVSNSGELMELLDKLNVRPPEGAPVSEEDMRKVTDSGDFCSLQCLANWANATDALRGLDAELENGTFLGDGDATAA